MYFEILKNFDHPEVSLMSAHRKIPFKLAKILTEDTYVTVALAFSATLLKMVSLLA